MSKEMKLTEEHNQYQIGDIKNKLPLKLELQKIQIVKAMK